MLPGTEGFYNSLNMEDITDVDYSHAKIVFKAFDNKILGNYYDLYVRVIHYYLWMYLKALEINVLKYMNLILLISYPNLD